MYTNLCYKMFPSDFIFHSMFNTVIPWYSIVFGVSSIWKIQISKTRYDLKVDTSTHHTLVWCVQPKDHVLGAEFMCMFVN